MSKITLAETARSESETCSSILSIFLSCNQKITPASYAKRGNRRITAEITNRHERRATSGTGAVCSNKFRKQFRCERRKRRRAREQGVDGWRTSTDGKGWTERTERAAEGEGKQFRPEISIKAKRRKSAPAVTVNFSSVLHLTAA